MRNVPVPATGLNQNIGAISTGYSHALALTTTGGVKAWGNNTDGQLGTAQPSLGSVPAM